MPAPRPLDDPDAFRVSHAIRDAIPTRVHAEMLMDVILDGLGRAAWTESYNDGSRHLVFRRERPDADVVVPTPLISLDTRGRQSAVVMIARPEGAPDEPPPRPGRVPKLRNLGPGEVLLYDGPHSITITYGDDGRWKEITRGGPKETLAGVLPALAKKTANPVELLGEFMANLDLSRHGKGRVRMPVPMPNGVRASWLCGLHAIRTALFEDRLPGGAGWAIADGWTGRALAWGVTREKAEAAWQEEVQRVRPWPEKPVKPPEPPPKESVEQVADPVAGTIAVRMTLRGPSSDVRLPEPTLANTPAVMIALSPEPDGDAPFGRWTRLLGPLGETISAALRREPDGFTLLGDRLAAVVEFDELEESLTAADEDFDARSFPTPPRPAGFPAPPPADTRVRTYRLVNEQTGRSVRPEVTSQSSSAGFRPTTLDGERLRWSALQLRRTTPAGVTRHC